MSGPSVPYYYGGNTKNPNGVTLDDGSTAKDHKFKSKEEVDDFNLRLKEQARIRAAEGERKKTIDILSTNGGRNDTILAGKNVL
jgi:hypothetical protein